eukprot:CAMPEP_0170549490 /NCGR_PEP_ID=MMETSP0211-20121228/7641_1 /TAXON_ID=311385 /ORGANISM="Pseudokeronopsis sp., Strain OXSARD2" /LENGTH=64 /DNA_ID=CAMNT_0010855533 /DNA_START=695 /DNA_END=889 /DNA_ORIENTATION=+
MLGAIALTSGTRTLQQYIVDMEDRGQTQDRIKEVTEALFPYANYITPSKVVRGDVAPQMNEEGK